MTGIQFLSAAVGIGAPVLLLLLSVSLLFFKWRNKAIFWVPSAGIKHQLIFGGSVALLWFR